MNKAVELQNITKKYGSRYIFKDFSLSIEAGEMLALVGVSGSGKSTLLNLIGMLEPYDGGQIKISGKKIPKIQSKEATLMRRNNINYLFQTFALISEMSVCQNLLLAMNFLNISKKEKNKKIDDVLQQVNMLALKNEIVNTLSGGEQQRVALARTVLKTGNIVLADEPTGALDAKSAEKAFVLIQNLCKKYGKTVIMVTHSMDLAKKADRIIDLTEI